MRAPKWFFLVALAPVLCCAQTYPSKPVKIIVPAQPGGGLDLIGRTIGDQLARAFGEQFVIENVGGGGGSIACQQTARAAPDGYTLMVGYVATHATSPAVRKVPYDAIKDFTPVAMVGGTRNMLVVHPSVPVNDLKEFIGYAKGKANKVTFGAGGIGTLNHLLIEQLKVAGGFETVIAQYKGIGPAFADMFGGQLEAMTPGLAAALPHIRNRRVKPIAVTGLKRHELLPEVPTFEESGFKGFDGVQWYGIVGPAKMSREVTQRLNAEIGKALAEPALQQRLVAEAIEPMPMSPEQFGAFIKTELDRYVALARERNIRLDE
ncbi:MAG TPA: tripartite tricarboxylate transporter substrate binding protein [Burkholderiales bacterium]|nr:tripartite tricarboxylate transporter substrate binding protein [Burkholderiales bacterium]